MCLFATKSGPYINLSLLQQANTNFLVHLDYFNCYVYHGYKNFPSWDIYNYNFDMIEIQNYTFIVHHFNNTKTKSIQRWSHIYKGWAI